MENAFRINSNLVVDLYIKDFLSCNCRINNLILSFNTLPEVNYLSTGDKPDTVSYLPLKKVESVLNGNIDPFSDGIGRVNIKVGRLVYKLFDKSLIQEYVSDFDVENFVNQYKSFFDQSNSRLVIVEGEDIKKYYLDENYYFPDRGTLWNSCMRYRERQKFLDLYQVNSDKIKMLVLLTQKDEVERVKGRALLWNHVQDGSGATMKIMDRIYTINDSDVIIFKRWARDNGYITKAYQNAKSQNVFDVDGEEKIINLSVKLDNHKLRYYPYLDTFQFYDEGKGLFHNSYMKPHDYVLIQSNGSRFPPEPEPEPDPDFEPDEQEW